MSALSDKLAAQKFAFEDVTICLDGSLAAEREEARRALRVAEAVEKAAKEGKGDTRLATLGKAVKAAQKALDAIDARVREVAVTIRITAVPFGKYNKFVIQNPPRKGKDESLNPETFYMFVARRTGKYVTEDGALQDVSEEEWDKIEESLTDGEHDKLAQAIFRVNRQDSMRGIDFLSPSSGKTESFSENSEPLEDSESPTDD